MSKLDCSLIVPVLNEEEEIGNFLAQLKPLKDRLEILFVDGGSDDKSAEIIDKNGFKCIKSKKGRAAQMNEGVKHCDTTYLLFLHADVYWQFDILSIIHELICNKVQLANFKLKFDSTHWFLRFNATFSKFTCATFQFGDQGLWISRQLFIKIGGFDENFLLLEDNEILKRARLYSKLYKLKATLIVSARKYQMYGVYKLQFLYYKLYLMYLLGIPIEQLNKSMINDR